MVSNKTKKILDGYVEYLENLSPSTIDALNKYVSNNVRFKDPFNDVTGIEKMKVVFRHMFENIQNVKFMLEVINILVLHFYVQWLHIKQVQDMFIYIMEI